MHQMSDAPAPAGRPWEARFRQFRVLRVIRTTTLTPLMRRVTLGGDEIEGIGDGPNVKILVPPTGAGDPEWPMQDAKGTVTWPALEKRPVARTFSVRRYDAGAGELDIDFVLHGEGAASTWAAAAAPGDLLGVGRPGGLTIRPASWYLLAGDLSALPAIGRILENLPATATGLAFVEIPNAGEEQPIDTRSQVRLTWLHRDRVSGESALLEDAVRAVDWPPSEDVFAWVAGESHVVRNLRQHLRDVHALDFRRCLAFGYWRRGMTETAYHQAHDHDRDEDYHRARAGGRE